jgi:anti-sigma B factor antagonist
MSDEVRPSERPVGRKSAGLNPNTHNEATRRSSGRASGKPGNRAPAIDPVATYARILLRRVNSHLKQAPSDVDDASALEVLQTLGRHLAELLEDLQEARLHLRQLSDGNLDDRVEGRGPATTAVRELRHELRALRVRMAALASGDMEAHDDGEGLMGPELAQVCCAMHRDSDITATAHVTPAEEDGALRIRAQGTMDALSVSLTIDALDEAAQNGAVVMLDLSDIAYIDSAGMGLIRRYARKLEDAGGSLLLVGVQDTVMDTIRQLGLEAKLMCFATVEQARQALDEADGRRARHPRMRGELPARLLTAAVLR